MPKNNKGMVMMQMHSLRTLCIRHHLPRRYLSGRERRSRPRRPATLMTCAAGVRAEMQCDEDDGGVSRKFEVLDKMRARL